MNNMFVRSDIYLQVEGNLFSASCKYDE